MGTYLVRVGAVPRGVRWAMQLPVQMGNVEMSGRNGLVLLCEYGMRYGAGLAELVLMFRRNWIWGVCVTLASLLCHLMVSVWMESSTVLHGRQRQRPGTAKANSTTHRQEHSSPNPTVRCVVSPVHSCSAPGQVHHH